MYDVGAQTEDRTETLAELNNSILSFPKGSCFKDAKVFTATTLLHAQLDALTNETDRDALFAVRSQIPTDPDSVFRSWNASIHFCSWEGVTCSARHQRVVALNLSSLNLAGKISPYIGNLSFIEVIDLTKNSLSGQIPQQISQLYRLQHLLLTNNSFQGEIPRNLSYCPNLEILGLSGNDLDGEIPAELASLSRLTVIGLANNHCRGRVPAWVGNLTLVASLSLLNNNLEGTIPAELGRLSNMQFFQLGGNKLTGTVPEQLFNLSSVSYFSISNNQLQGQIPPDLGIALPNIQGFFLGGNRSTGQLPVSLANASNLVQIDMAVNNLTGLVPNGFGVLQNLQSINFDGNQLGDSNADDLSFLASLTNCTNLRSLSMFWNNLQGRLPESVGNLSTKLNVLRLHTNHITGNIPAGIVSLRDLNLLALSNNKLTGRVPDSIGELYKLQEIYFQRNSISGEIPSSFGNLTGLRRLNLAYNELEGNIPVSFGNCMYLEGADLSNNQLSGEIPKEFVGLSSFSIGLFLHSNKFTGLLPTEVGNLRNLNRLDISENELSGMIPSALESCQLLEILNMSGNLFEGTISSSLRVLRGIRVLDLSRNNLSGQIPEFLGELPLRNFNLSSNNFDGELPTGGVFGNMNAFSVLGNKQLCGGIKALELQKCPSKNLKGGKHFPHRLIIGISIALFIILLSASLRLIHFRLRSSKTLSSAPSSEANHPRLSYADLFHATDGFSSAKIVGRGRYGSVYKGTLGNNDQTVAVKVFNLQQEGAAKIFLAECEALRNTRHRNLVKIVTSCSSIDFQGNDFKALVFEFMSNGSLESWLHPSSTEQPNPRNLNLCQRLNLAIDVASALRYLHCEHDKPIVHCDLKPSNILLDGDFTYVSDFGLTKFLSASTEQLNQENSSSMGIRGTVGYIAPEYGMGGEVSILGDVYSYGILVLELFTGISPTDSMYAENFNLRDFVKMAVPSHLMETIDPQLRSDGETTSTNSKTIMECVASILQVGVFCSENSPRESMNIEAVLAELHKIRDLLSVPCKRGRKKQ